VKDFADQKGDGFEKVKARAGGVIIITTFVKYNQVWIHYLLKKQISEI